MKLTKATKARYRRTRISNMIALLKANDYRVETYRINRVKRYQVWLLDTCKCCGELREEVVAHGKDEEKVCRKVIKRHELSWGDYGSPKAKSLDG